MLGDNNTKYFHTKSKIRKSRNKITKINSHDCIRYTTQGETSKQITENFKNRFKKNNNCHFNETTDFDCIKEEVTNEDNELLIREVIDEEILDTINQMALNKFPGPDGFNIEFFKRILAHCGEGYIQSYQSLFSFKEDVKGD